MRKPAARKRKKADWSRSTRAHQVQNTRALVQRSKRARRKRKEEGRIYQDQSP